MRYSGFGYRLFCCLRGKKWHRASFWQLLKKQGNSTFCKVVKQKGEGKPTFSTRSFPLSLFIYPKLCSFGLLLKMRCIFFTEQSCGDQGSPPGPPMPCFVAQSFALCNSARCLRSLSFGRHDCFCRLCNFDLPNKQRFSLQRHKSRKKLRFLRYSACAEFLDSLL